MGLAPSRSGRTMPKLSANLSWLFSELPFTQRFAAAAECGFKAVEYAWPAESPEQLAPLLKKHGLKQALFNLSAGPNPSDRGLAALPGREKDFDETVDRGIEMALALECPRMHVMAGMVKPGDDVAKMTQTYRSNLKRAAEKFAKHGLEICIEALNPRDNRGYFLSTSAQAIETIDAIGAPNVKFQFDIFHCQVAEGDLTGHINALKGRFSHVQIAGNPGRHEPNVGEINYEFVLKALDDSGYDGWVGCEYKPATTTREGLGWARPYGIKA